MLHDKGKQGPKKFATIKLFLDLSKYIPVGAINS
jgi:hypothetical protein